MSQACLHVNWDIYTPFPEIGFGTGTPELVDEILANNAKL